jgi:processing peptidase subunit beta
MSQFLQDTGLFGVYGVCDPTTVNDFCWFFLISVNPALFTLASGRLTMNCFVRMCHKVTDEEVARARTQLKSQMLSSLDGSSAVAEDIGRQLLTYGRRLTPAEIFSRIDAVDANAVMNTAKTIIDDQVYIY